LRFESINRQGWKNELKIEENDENSLGKNLSLFICNSHKTSFQTMKLRNGTKASGALLNYATTMGHQHQQKKFAWGRDLWPAL
jgi:hypothetical protein